MKKQSTQIKFLMIVAAYFLLNGCIPREVQTREQWQVYAQELERDGYSIKAAQHIAKVEFNIIPADDFYTALIED